ncbi:CD48 antigen-like isoform X1 [Ictidomys tridecemlineatus]
MGHSSQDPHLCWTTRLLGGIIFLCACSTLAKSSGAHGSGIKGFRTHTYLKAIRGGSVLLHVIQEPEDPKIEEITWGFASDSNSTFMLRLQNGKEDPLWFSLQDKYKQRVQMPSMSSLRINNLTSQDSGQYWAQIMCQTGREIKAVFNLTVYDPVPLAQIQTTSVSITPSWCNVTLDCGAREAVEVLNVTWEVQGPPSEREQRGAPGPPNPWTLALSLPLRQPNVSLTCVLSNPVDQKNATFQLVDLCSPAPTAGHSRAAIGAFLAGFFILGVGGLLFLWHLGEKKKKKKMEMEMERGLEVSLAQNQAPVCQDSDAGLPEDPRAKDEGVYAQLMAQDSLKGKRKDIDEKHLEGKGPCTSVYSVVQRPGQAGP